VPLVSSIWPLPQPIPVAADSPQPSQSNSQLTHYTRLVVLNFAGLAERRNRWKTESESFRTVKLPYTSEAEAQLANAENRRSNGTAFELRTGKTLVAVDWVAALYWGCEQRWQIYLSHIASVPTLHLSQLIKRQSVPF